MNVLAADPAYAALLTRFPPRVIRTEEQNESSIEALYELEQCRDHWNPEQAELADLLTLLIEDFEEKHYQLPPSSPLERLSFLMEQHGLKQKDLADVFGTPSIVSEVLRGRRQLNKEHIRKLSERFHVSPELFF
ncbi:MAG TPA: helix-turn-helix domain-containing protein [Terracidiphilus sp.]|nr:helix-turn-helix domain-containing protein [Terracidiphilus sp.]